jgi:hypothetical protein
LKRAKRIRRRQYHPANGQRYSASECAFPGDELYSAGKAALRHDFIADG